LKGDDFTFTDSNGVVTNYDWDPIDERYEHEESELVDNFSYNITQEPGASPRHGWTTGDGDSGRFGDLQYPPPS
jgi:hypothetical protein